MNEGSSLTEETKSDWESELEELIRCR